MSKYTFIKHRDPENEYDLSAVTMEIEAIHISDVVREFADFLKASGFGEKRVNEVLDLDQE